MKHTLINCKLPIYEFEVAGPNEIKISDIGARVVAYVSCHFMRTTFYAYFEIKHKRRTHPPSPARKHPTLANFIHKDNRAFVSVSGTFFCLPRSQKFETTGCCSVETVETIIPAFLGIESSKQPGASEEDQIHSPDIGEFKIKVAGDEL